MSPIALVFAFPLALVMVMMAAPLALPLGLVLLFFELIGGEFCRPVRDFVAKHFATIRFYFELVAEWVRYVWRVASNPELLFGVRGALQEIEEIINMVETKRWPETLDDPAVHIMYEARRGRMGTGFLLYGDYEA